MTATHNGGRIGRNHAGGICSDSLTEEDRDDLRKWWDDEFQGSATGAMLAHLDATVSGIVDRHVKAALDPLIDLRISYDDMDGETPFHDAAEDIRFAIQQGEARA